MEETVETWFTTLSNTIGTPAGKALLNEWLHYQTRYPFASVRNTILLLSQLDKPAQLGTYDGWAAAPQHTSSANLTNTSAIWLFDSLIDRVCPHCGAPKYDHPSPDDPDCSATPSPSWTVKAVKPIPTALFPHSPPTNSSNSYSPPYSQPLTPVDEYSIALSEAFPANFDGTRFPTLHTPADILTLIEYLTAQTPLTHTPVPHSEWSKASIADFTLRDPYDLTPVVRTCLPTIDAPEKHLQAALEIFCYVLFATEIAPDEATVIHEKKAALAAYGLATLCNTQAHFSIPLNPPQPSLTQWANLSLSTLQQYCTDIRNCLTTLLVGQTPPTRQASMGSFV